MTRSRILQDESERTEDKKAVEERQKGHSSEKKSSTAFSPQNGNIEDGTGSPGSFLRSIGFEPLENRLNSLFQPNYHFRFYLDTDIQGAAGGESIFIIAETGLTGMNLQDVTVESFVGPNLRTKNANSTSITMKIYEPFGSQLPDLLFQAAVRMRIRNYLKAPWYLDLRFHGYDGETGKIVNVDGKWKWKLSLIDVQSNISENGTLHTITAMPLSEVALNDQICRIPKVMPVSGNTVGEVLKNLQDSLNKDIGDRYGKSDPLYIEYVIEDEPYPRDTKVNVARPFDHRISWDIPQLSNQQSAPDYDSQYVQFPPGQDIPSIVDTLMASSDTAVKQARISRTLPPEGEPDLEENPVDVVSVMHRVSTKVEYLDYNPIIGDYHKRVTFTIRPYDSLRILTSLGRAKSFDKERDLNRIKAKHAVDNAFLRKQYDYVFTGLNTEVEKFDINVNFRWGVSVPVLLGKQFAGFAAKITDPVIAEQNGLELQGLNQRRDELEVQLREPQPDSDDPSDEAAAARARRAEIQAQYDDLSEQIRRRAEAQGRATNQLLAQSRAEEAESRRLLPVTPIFDGEDAIYANLRTGGQYAGRLASKDNKSFLPITIIQDPNNVSRNIETGSAVHNDKTKSVYGTLLNQMYGVMDGNLQSIELEIRGDPYWLGHSDDGTDERPPSNDDQPNFMNGEHMFVFRFKLPLGIDEETGRVNLDKESNSESDSSTPRESLSNIFTGFYAVTTVTHRFSEGKFSQKLNAVRIQGWTYENIIEGRGADFENPLVDAPPPAGTGISSRNPPAPNQTNLKLDDTTLLALTLYGEARGEGNQGMQAVGNVIMNRVRNPQWPNSINGVILESKQFSVWNDRSPQSVLNRINSLPTDHPDRRSFNQAFAVAQKIKSGTLPDITFGSTFYYAPRGVSRVPSWATPGTRTTVIGKHIFHRRPR